MSTTIHHDTTGDLDITKRDVCVRIGGESVRIPAGTKAVRNSLTFGAWMCAQEPFAFLPDIAMVAPDLSPVCPRREACNADGMVIQALSNLNAKLMQENEALTLKLTKAHALLREVVDTVLPVPLHG